MLKIKLGERHFRARGITGIIATILFVPALLVMVVALAIIFVLAIPAVGVGMLGAEEVAGDD